MDNQKVSKKELSLWFLVIAATIGLALITAILVLPMTNAHAAADKHVVNKRETWSMNRYYPAPDTVGFGTHVEGWKVTINTNYVFWPDGNSVNKIAVASGSVCYDHITDTNGFLFQGVNANPIWLDDNNVVNIGAIEVGEDGEHACTGFFIPYTKRVWFRMDQDPAWGATGKVRIQLENDDDFIFKWMGSDTRYFHPGDDPEISDWYYCECDYGGANH